MEIKQLRYLLGLLSLPGMGPAIVSKILRTTKDLSVLFNAKDQCLAPLEGEVNWALVDADLQWVESSSDHTILTLDHPSYPPPLKEIHMPPPVLYARGALSFLKQPQIAIVGSRNPSKQGKDLAFLFAESFSSMGLTVTSGLALGVDGAAHQGALKGKGGTIAVLGNGLAQIYPKRHKALAEEIVSRGQGVLISEFSLQIGPWSSNFPRRNRIISGLSLGVLVVEAALKSGSLITAKHALNQGREVFAIPSSIHNPLAKGCHQLIQQGAKLVQTVQDVLEELNAYPRIRKILSENKKVLKLNNEGSKRFRQVNFLEGGLARLLDKVSYGTTTIDTLVEASGLTVALVSSMLLELELMGAVIPVPGGYSRA